MIDTPNPTAERLAKALGDFELGNDRAQPVLRMVDQPLERARRQGRISDVQYRAGTKFHHHWHHAGLAGRLQSVDMNGGIFGRGDGIFASEAASHHLKQYRNAVAAMDPKCAWVVEQMTCYDKSLKEVGNRLGYNSEGPANAAATELLQIGLNALIRLWGL